MLNQNIVIIIPTYNEELNIEETIHEISQIKSELRENQIRVLIFDSASTDNTVEKVIQAQLKFDWLFLEIEPQKTGLGSAYLQAMKFSLTNFYPDVVIEFDADLSHQPKYLKKMIELLKNHDVVVGSRYVSNGSIPSDWGWHRKALSKLGNQLARLFITRKYFDFTSGFRATKRHVLEKALKNHFLSNHYAYKLHLFWLLHHLNANIIEFPIDFVDRTKGKSKLPKNSIIDSLRVLITLKVLELKNKFGGN